MVETAAAGLAQENKKVAVRVCVMLDNVYGIFRVAEMVRTDRHAKTTTTTKT